MQHRWPRSQSTGDSYYAPGLHDRIAWGEALRIGLAHYKHPR
jgi:hypothetical protein